MSESLSEQELLRRAVDHPGSLDWKGEGNPWRAEVVGIWRDAAAKWAEFLDDPVAVVRRGVESGTIKGEVQWLCREDDRVHDWVEGSPVHCWFRGIGKHNPECGPHVFHPGF